MDRAWLLRCAVAACTAAAMAARGRRRGALSASGAAAAFGVGLATMAASYAEGALLILFYLSSSKVMRVAHREAGVASWGGSERAARAPAREPRQEASAAAVASSPSHPPPPTHTNTPMQTRARGS